MKKLLLFVFAVLAFAACEQAPIEEMQGVAISDRSLEVSFEGADDTRIQLQGGKTVWTEGDHVSVFYRSTVNEEWQFMGKTGDRTGQIVPVDNSVNPPATHNRVVVIYPYNKEYYLNTEKYSIEASLPAVQNYLEDSYSTNGNIMVSSNDYKQVSLKSVCGWLKLQLTGDGEVVKSITLRGNNGEQVAGLIYVDSAAATATLASASGEAGDDEVGGTLVRPGTILTEVTLDCGEGVALGKNATAFYIALPPQTFEKGFKVEIVCADDTKMVKSSNKALSIERNHIQPMAEFSYTANISPSNQIWYTSTDGEVVKPNATDVFGANIVSNTYENDKGIITFDAPVTSIGERAFYDCDNLKSITIPNSVTSIAKGALACCDSLTSLYSKFASTDNRCLVINGVLEHFIPAGLAIYTIPDGVTGIGDHAFNGCNNLTSVIIPDSVTSIGYRAFYYCSSLTNVTIPDSVTSIGEDAFHGCNSLTSVTITDLSAWCKIDFGGYYANPLSYAKTLYLNNSEVTNLTIPSDITEIKKYTFRYCSSLTSVTIGNSVTSIVNDAFAGCTSLTSITIPDSVTEIGSAVFWKCTSLTSVTIPDSVTSIGKQAFDVCSSLTSVYCKPTTPPAGGQYMFDQSASGRKIYVPYNSVNAYKSAEYWSRYASDIVGYDFENGEIVEVQPNNQIWYTSSDGDVVTPYKTNVFGANIISNTYENGQGIITFDGDVTMIGGSAFKECSSLTSVTIPNSVTSIGEYTFHKCSSLTSVTIPDSVTTIGICAFRDCQSLTSVIIPDSVTSIGDGVFLSCYSLPEFKGKFAEDNGRILVADGTLIAFAPSCGATEYTIPDSVIIIELSAFRDCQSLTSVTIPDSVTTIKSYAFCACSSLKSVTIPNSVTSIGENVFRNCSNLKSVTIGNSVTSIERQVFQDCSSLKSVTIGNSVTTIGDYAFHGCSSLTSITIPDSVTEIGEYAFRYCTGLQTVYCKPITPPTIASSMFAPGWWFYIYVPRESMDAYISATNWSEYAKYIIGYNF